MKKIISLLLSLTFVFSATCLTSCGKNKNDEPTGPIDMKLGIGVHTDTVKSSAEGSKNGALENVYTVAAVVFDSNGKIIKCKLDAIETSVAFTKGGVAVASGEFKSKRELGDSYVMSQDPSKLKWYEQADAFAKVCEGKTTEEVKTLLSSGGKGNSDVISAGCTITVSEFVSAIEKSAADLKDYNASKTKDVNLKIKVKTSGTDATAAAVGTAEIVCDVSASVADGNKTVASVSKNDKSSVKFNTSGVLQ